MQAGSEARDNLQVAGQKAGYPKYLMKYGQVYQDAADEPPLIDINR